MKNPKTPDGRESREVEARQLRVGSTVYLPSSFGGDQWHVITAIVPHEDGFLRIWFHEHGYRREWWARPAAVAFVA